MTCFHSSTIFDIRFQFHGTKNINTNSKLWLFTVKCLYHSNRLLILLVFSYRNVRSGISFFLVHKNKLTHKDINTEIIIIQMNNLFYYKIILATYLKKVMKEQPKYSIMWVIIILHWTFSTQLIFFFWKFGLREKIMQFTVSATFLPNEKKR